MAKKNKNDWCVNVVACGNHAAPGSLYCFSCKPSETQALELPAIHTDPLKQMFVALYSRHHPTKKVED